MNAKQKITCWDCLDAGVGNLCEKHAAEKAAARSSSRALAVMAMMTVRLVARCLLLVACCLMIVDWKDSC